MNLNIKRIINKVYIKAAEDKINIIGILLILLAVGVIFYSYNYYTPLFADDYSYSFSFLNGERISSISDIFSSMYGHYFVRNGRVVTHFIAQLFLFLGKDVFNIINTISFLTLGLLIYWHSYTKSGGD